MNGSGADDAHLPMKVDERCGERRSDDNDMPKAPALESFGASTRARGKNFEGEQGAQISKGGGGGDERYQEASLP